MDDSPEPLAFDLLLAVGKAERHLELEDELLRRIG